MVFARRSTTLLAAIIASCAMVLSLTACTSDNKTVVDGQTTVTSNSAGGVAVFTPFGRHYAEPADATEQMGEAWCLT